MRKIGKIPPIAVLVTALVALFLVSSMMPPPPASEEYDPSIFIWRLSDDSGLQGLDTIPLQGPEAQEASVEADPVLKPIELREDPSDVEDVPPIEELRRLADLEGRQRFQNLDPYSRYYLRNYPLGAYDVDADVDVLSMDVPMDNAEAGEEKERELEEADLVKLIDRTLYILNPYRGLIIVDLSVAGSPVILGRAPVVGTPVDMYVVDGRAFIVTTSDYGYWYRYMSYRQTAAEGWAVPTYHIGSKVSVVDVEDLSHPEVVTEVGLEGFITDSRRVGDVIYFVSHCDEWYDRQSEEEVESRTYVISLSFALPDRISVVDRLSFDGTSNEIHVTKEHLFVAQPQTVQSWSIRETEITLVDISDPRGHIDVQGSIDIPGVVNDRYQMDEYDGMLRVVSHFFDGIGESKLWIISLEDPDSMFVMGSLLIDDAGSLMATRFDGNRGYTIHLPQRVDPLDVLDLSDPYDPKLCDVFEMPGWVTHMEIRGMKILALGVSDGGQQVAMSLFDVTDPWNVVMEERVQLGDSRSWSEANSEPKALTVLDEQGLIVIPFTHRTEVDGRTKWAYSVQLVEFDLDTSELRLAGSFDQPDSVTRTRALGSNILSTSPGFLQVADVRDVDEPVVVARLDLCPEIVDIHEFGAYVAQMRRYRDDRGLTLRIMPRGYVDLGPSLGELQLGDGFERYYWNGDKLHSYTFERETDGVPEVTVCTVDLFGPFGPRKTGRVSFNLEENESLAGSYYSYYPHYYPDIDIEIVGFYRPYWYPYSSSIENPVMVDGDAMVFVGTTNLYRLDLADRYWPRLTSRTELGIVPVDVRASGHTLYLTEQRLVEKEYEDREDRLYEYYLYRVDLSDPYRMAVGDGVNIPGTPVGVSSDGSAIYTKAYWHLENGTWLTSLNVVGLTKSTATIEGAFELEDYQNLWVVNDKAYIHRMEYSYWYDDTLYRNVWSYNSTIEVIDLLRPEAPCPASMIKLSDYYATIRVVDDHIFVHSWNHPGIWVYDVTDDCEIMPPGFYMANGNINSIKMLEGRAVLIQGMYGATALDLT